MCVKKRAVSNDEYEISFRIRLMYIKYYKTYI